MKINQFEGGNPYSSFEERYGIHGFGDIVAQHKTRSFLTNQWGWLFFAFVVWSIHNGFSFWQNTGIGFGLIGLLYYGIKQVHLARAIRDEHQQKISLIFTEDFFCTKVHPYEQQKKLEIKHKLFMIECFVIGGILLIAAIFSQMFYGEVPHFGTLVLIAALIAGGLFHHYRREYYRHAVAMSERDLVDYIPRILTVA